ncbi:MAG: aldehyde dehydrogenase family protein, partial [Betaproteobacteria bacterium]|nr:aldehyde dehydrogenase family protein [Betaproteobacteria bacterium]
MNKPVDVQTLQSVPLWIDGKHKQASSTRAGDITNPATGQVTRRVPFCNAADIDAAVQAAQRAFPAWRDTPALRRARILMRFRELLDAN